MDLPVSFPRALKAPTTSTVPRRGISGFLPPIVTAAACGAPGATSMSSGKKGPKSGSSPSYTQVGNSNLVRPVKGPLVYKAAAQQDDLALVGIERQSILAPANQALDGPLEIGDRHGVQQGEVNKVK